MGCRSLHTAQTRSLQHRLHATCSVTAAAPPPIMQLYYSLWKYYTLQQQPPKYSSAVTAIARPRQRAMTNLHRSEVPNHRYKTAIDILHRDKMVILTSNCGSTSVLDQIVATLRQSFCGCTSNSAILGSLNALPSIMPCCALRCRRRPAPSKHPQPPG